MWNFPRIEIDRFLINSFPGQLYFKCYQYGQSRYKEVATHQYIIVKMTANAGTTLLSEIQNRNIKPRRNIYHA